MPKKVKLYSKTSNGFPRIKAESPVDIFEYKCSSTPFEPALFKFIKKHQKDENTIIGYFSYDLGNQLKNLKSRAKNDLNLPDIYLLAFNKTTNTILPKPTAKTYKSTNFTPEMSKANYNSAYRKIKDHIKEGNIYQINLTHRLHATTEIPAEELFNRIAEKNDVDFLAYLEGPGFEILSASPERFIKIEKGVIETCPVKGTRPRGKTQKEDEKMKKELIESEKEAAELNMITDLLRNDLGEVSEIGSVKVEGHRLISQCPTVWHTYSRITSKLRKGIHPIKALITMLSGGSITGCPKKRAMEIINELEPVQRGPYTGVIAIIHPNGDIDSSIAIRTVIKKDKDLYLQVGGGIVQDSTNASEYEETLHKAASFMNIL